MNRPNLPPSKPSNDTVSVDDRLALLFVNHYRTVCTLLPGLPKTKYILVSANGAVTLPATETLVEHPEVPRGYRIVEVSTITSDTVGVWYLRQHRGHRRQTYVWDWRIAGKTPIETIIHDLAWRLRGSGFHVPY